MNRSAFFKVVLLLVAVIAVDGKEILCQGLDSSIRGRVTDAGSAGALKNVTIQAKNQQTGGLQTVETDKEGYYVLPHPWLGNYILEADLRGYQRAVSPVIALASNRSILYDFALSPIQPDPSKPSANAVPVTATESGTTSILSGNTILDLPLPTSKLEPVSQSLSIYSPFVVTQPGSVVGVGNSAAGLRPTSNNFSVDGMDNNLLNWTGPALPVFPDTLAEFSLQPTNVAGSQLFSGASLANFITLNGSNQLHGSLFAQGSNRKLNAFTFQENQDLAAGLADERQRFDFFRGGATLGGAIIKERLFGFASYQYQSLGTAPRSYFGQSITNEGLETITEKIKGLSSNNVSILKDDNVWPKALVPNGNYAAVTGSDGVVHQVELGNLVGAANRYSIQRQWMTNIDYQTENQQMHGRFQYFNHDQPAINGQFAHSLYTGEQPYNLWMLYFSHLSPLRPNLFRETRLVFRRSEYDNTAPSSYGVESNYAISSLGLFMGPSSETPQSRKENLFQFVNNLTWLRGRHTYRTGLEYRKWDGRINSLANSRGSYDWKSLESFLKDEIPTGTGGATRGVGTSQFTDERVGVYLNFQDEVRLRPRLRIQWGVRYENLGNPRDASLQTDNEVASIPGKLEFREPQTDNNNIGPHLGISCDLFGNGKTVARGGYAMNFDGLAGEYTRLSLPPQFQQVLTPSLACTELDSKPNYCRNNSPTGPPNARGFLVSGGLPSTSIAPETVKSARLATRSFIPDTTSPDPPTGH
jgi:hypothetical protein